MEAAKIVLNNNSFCDTAGVYQVVVCRSNTAKMIAYGPKNQLNNLAFDYYDNQHISTHIYPLRSCWMNSTGKINLVIDTPKLIKIEDWTSSPITVVGFNKNEIPVTDSKLKALYLD